MLAPSRRAAARLNTPKLPHVMRIGSNAGGGKSGAPIRGSESTFGDFDLPKGNLSLPLRGSLSTLIVEYLDDSRQLRRFATHRCAPSGHDQTAGTF